MTATATPTAQAQATTPAPTEATQPVVAAPTTTEPQQAADKAAASPATPPKAEPAKLVSLLDEPAKAAEDQQKPDEKAKAPESDAAKVPDKYDWKLPEGDTIAPELDSALTEIAKAAGMSQEKAQEAFDKLMAASEIHSQQKLAQWVEKAAAATKADPEFGGTKLEAARVNVARAIKAYGSEELGSLLKTPLGVLMTNTPAMWRFLAKVGAEMAEDGFVTGRRSAPKQPTATDFYKAITPQ